MRASLAVGFGLLSLAGCRVGHPVEHFAPAHGPQGVQAEATVAAANPAGVRPAVKGELVEVRDDGLLMLGELLEQRQRGGRQVSIHHPDWKPQLVLVPFDQIREARFVGLGCCTLRGGRAPNDDERTRLRFVSRFPQGLAPELLRQLLEASGQTEVRRLGP